MFSEPTEIARLATAENPAMAHVWEEALQAESIRCMVVGDYLDASFGDIPGLKPELWVHRRDLLRAEAIINEVSDAGDEDSAPVGTDFGAE